MLRRILLLVLFCAVALCRGDVEILGSFTPTDFSSEGLAMHRFLLPDESGNSRGNSPPVLQVVGGEDTSITRFNYLVALQVQFRGDWFFVCGGFLATPTKVVTAAHCVTGDLDGLPFRVLAGSDEYFVTPQAQVIDVARIYVHPNYQTDRNRPKRGLYANDLAVLRLERPSQLGERVGILPLAERYRTFEGQSCVLAGFGLTSLDSGPSSIMTANLTVISTRECQERSDDRAGDGGERVIYLKPLHVCTLELNRSGCFGDSGSALVCGGVAVGVLSFGDSFCDVSGVAPSGWTSVSWHRRYLDFLLSW